MGWEKGKKRGKKLSEYMKPRKKRKKTRFDMFSLKKDKLLDDQIVYNIGGIVRM